MTTRPQIIAVVGTGPRGVLLLERLIAQLKQQVLQQPVELHAIDACELGCGKVWRTDQPDCLVMDNSVDEMTLYSTEADVDKACAGQGPSFASWLARQPSADSSGITIGPVTYPPRRLYGRYLKFVYNSLSEGLPKHLSLKGHQATISGIEPQELGYHLILEDQESPLFAHSVVLCTGHATLVPDTRQQQIQAFADTHGLTYVAPVPAVDMQLDSIGSQHNVGILGLGLSFYDALMLLTEARGGHFTPDRENRLHYRRSGREPELIVAGSRTGVPIPVRGLQQRPPGWRYVPRLFTEQQAHMLRERAPLDFRQDVQPWINAEINLVYFETLLRQCGAPDTRIHAFAENVRSRIHDGAGLLQALGEQRAADGLGRYPLLDLQRLANPFAHQQFDSPADFQDRLLQHVRQDLQRALQGNVDNPLKAALETLRDTRAIQRITVDFCGLTAQSHRQFIDTDSQPLSFLSAGTPLYRSQQLLALIDAGLLRIVGPGTVLEMESAAGRFNLHSPAVSGSSVQLDALIDARLPKINIHRDYSPLTRQLLNRGVWSSRKNLAGATAFDTGGVNVEPDAYRPLSPEGQVWNRLHVLGLPTEHTRWFMQVGIVRPGQEKSGLGQDCERVVAQLCKDLHETSR